MSNHLWDEIPVVRFLLLVFLVFFAACSDDIDSVHSDTQTNYHFQTVELRASSVFQNLIDCSYNGDSSYHPVFNPGIAEPCIQYRVCNGYCFNLLEVVEIGRASVEECFRYCLVESNQVNWENIDSCFECIGI